MRVIIIAILVLLFYSCNGTGPQKSDKSSVDNMEVPMAQRTMAAPPPTAYDEAGSEAVEEVVIEENNPSENSADPTQNEKKIIKDGRIEIEVDDLEAAKKNVDDLVKSKGAYYSNDRFDDSEYRSSYILKIRIPSDDFESFVSELYTQKGKITSKEISSRDVTTEFIDLETRLANKRKYLEKYRDLLGNAKSVKDILEIQNEIRALEEEIESTVGRLKYLKDLVGYSTLNLVLAKKKEFKYDPDAQDSFFERLKQSLFNGWKTGVSFVLLLVSLWPLWLIIPAFVFLWRKIRKTRKSAK